MDINDVLEKYYKDITCGKDIDVNEETLWLFVKEFMEIKNLKDEYKKDSVNRKELGKEILNRIQKIKPIMDFFTRDLNRDANKYVYPDYISDCSKAMELLLVLANTEEDKYAMKKFYVEQMGALNVRGDKMHQGEIRVIGEKDVLDAIDNSISYDGTSFGLLATNLVKKHHSLVAITNLHYETNVLPCWYDLKAKRKKFRVNGLFSKLYCYTYDDELGKAVDILDDYIETYGGDIDNIDIEDLLYRIEGNKSLKIKKKLK